MWYSLSVTFCMSVVLSRNCDFLLVVRLWSYNFMWYSLSVTWCMLVVFSRDWFPSSCEVVVIQLYVIQFVSDLMYVGSFLQVLWFPPSCEVILIQLYVKLFVSDLLCVCSFFQGLISFLLWGYGHTTLCDTVCQWPDVCW